MPKFIARCSSLGKLMTEPRGKSGSEKYNELYQTISDNKTKLSDIKPHLKSYANLQEKIAKQEDDLKVLEKLRHNPNLSETCITEIETWMKEQLYGNYHGFSSKYTTKGLMCEDEAIQFASKYYGWESNVKKNTERKTNEFITGECDVNLHELIADIKNCWSEKTFPLFSKDIPIDGYGYQGLGYLELYTKPKFQLTYTLMDAPDLLVDQEARRKQYELGLDEVDFELWEEVKNKMTFSHLPDELRIKSYFLDYDISVIESIYSKIEDIRKYINDSGFNELYKATR